MSGRGADFLDRWLADNLPQLVNTDIISVGKATEKLFRDAQREGIEVWEIAEETGSIYETVLDAIVHHHDPGQPGLTD
jgi:hypothetical protein